MPKNELAELAEELKNVACEYADDKPIVSKAQRIIAELAKVKVARSFYGEICYPTTEYLREAFENILKIAEKGERK